MPSVFSDTLATFSREFGPYYFGLLLLPFLCFFFRKKVSTEFRRLFPLMAYWAVSEYVGLVAAERIGSNAPVHHLYTVVYYLLAVYYFYPLLKAEKGMVFYLFASCFLLFLFSVLNAIYFQPWLVTPTNAIMVHCLFLLTICLFSFKQLLENPIALPLQYQSQFWVSAGILVFNSWAFFFFATHAYFLQIGNYPLLFLRIPELFSFIMLLFFLAAFWAEIKTNQTRNEPLTK
jgi:hypothetical protein